VTSVDAFVIWLYELYYFKYKHARSVAAVQVQHAIIGARCCAWLPLARYNNNGAVGTGARRAAHCSALNENQRQARGKN
jgi:hypothetical protein